MQATPSDPLEFLFSLERLGMKFGLENITRLCEALGHPEQAFRSIIVGGTNGKGSVTAMVATALGAAGHRAARYTSPHLVRLEERFVVDGREIETDTLRDSVARVRTAVDGLLLRKAIDATPTFFECTTAVAFDLFRRAGVDVAVLEVGLGGRLDATNVVLPIAAAITSIDLDHQAQLGDTIVSIAREKAGIVKPGIPVVCGPLTDDAERVVREICAERGAAMVRAADTVEMARRGDAERPTVDVRSGRLSLDGVRLALAGRHQIDNATVAVALLDALAARGVSTDRRAVRAGLEDAVWPARLERFTTPDADVLLDAAHNPAGSRALASYLKDIGWAEITLLFAVMHDKDVEGMIAPLAPLCSAVICTTPPTPRAIGASELAARVAATPGLRARVEPVDDPAAALERARALGPRIVCAGSIFLIGPLRDILR